MPQYTPRTFKNYPAGAYRTSPCYPSLPPSTCESACQSMVKELDEQCVNYDKVCLAANSKAGIDCVSYCAKIS